MWKIRIITLLLLVGGAALGSYVYQSEQSGTNPFRLGLDLRGGSYLVYQADTSSLEEADIQNSMDALRDVIERRINAFGIAEPNVQTESASIGTDGTQERLVIELPGVTDLQEAVALIGQTPVLEFKAEADEAQQLIIQAEVEALLAQEELEGEGSVSLAELEDLQNRMYVDTGLTGRYLQKSQLQFSQAGIQSGGSLQSEPIIALSFDSEGAEMFEQITRENIGKTIAIYLDGSIISAPVVNTAIAGGQAVIQGNFTIDEAKDLVGRLNSGALPIPIELISTNTIGPTLGQSAVDRGVYSGLLGLIIVSLVLILWYRLPGLIATIALLIYTIIMLWIFKFLPVTLTSAGIAGFIISIGIAVDANILIFERMKEELQKGNRLYDAVLTGFSRAWPSIRDSNISSLITALFLFWFGTALIKGFALTFGLGILVSMFTAITVTRLLLLSLTKKDSKSNRIIRFLYHSGLNK